MDLAVFLKNQIDLTIFFSLFSLVKALLDPDNKADMNAAEQITDGIDICPWTVYSIESEECVTFSIWDFAGQTVYYNTHQVLSISIMIALFYSIVWSCQFFCSCCRKKQ